MSKQIKLQYIIMIRCYYFKISIFENCKYLHIINSTTWRSKIQNEHEHKRNRCIKKDCARASSSNCTVRRSNQSTRMSKTLLHGWTGAPK